MRVTLVLAMLACAGTVQANPGTDPLELCYAEAQAAQLQDQELEAHLALCVESYAPQQTEAFQSDSGDDSGNQFPDETTERYQDNYDADNSSSNDDPHGHGHGGGYESREEPGPGYGGDAYSEEPQEEQNAGDY